MKINFIRVRKTMPNSGIYQVIREDNLDKIKQLIPQDNINKKYNFADLNESLALHNPDLYSILNSEPRTILSLAIEFEAENICEWLIDNNAKITKEDLPKLSKIYINKIKLAIDNDDSEQIKLICNSSKRQYFSINDVEEVKIYAEAKGKFNQVSFLIKNRHNKENKVHSI